MRIRIFYTVSGQEQSILVRSEYIPNVGDQIGIEFSNGNPLMRRVCNRRFHAESPYSSHREEKVADWKVVEIYTEGI